MSNVSAANLPRLEPLIEERKDLVIRTCCYALMLVCYPFSLLWYVLDAPYLVTTCLTTAVIGTVMLARRKLQVRYQHAGFTLLLVGAACTYTSLLVYWDSLPIVACYFPVVVMMSWLLFGLRISLMWGAFCGALIISIPFIAPHIGFHVHFSKQLVDFLNVAQVLCILSCGLAVLYLYSLMSQTLITELINNKHEIEKTQKDLLSTQRARERFFASISHEIRTPMNAVRGIAELLAHDKGLSTENAELVHFLQRSSTHLLSLINDLLDLSKLEENKVRLVPIDFDLREVIYDAYIMVRYAAAEKNLEIRKSIDSQLPKYIHADSNRLRQILVNLLNNAVKFTSEGFVSLECELQSTATHQAVLRIKIKDSGIGMSDQDKRNIFKDYAQGNDEISQKFGGTGLGLNITRRIVELHGGKIWFESELGKGSTFYVDLPMQTATTLANVGHETPQQLDAFIIEMPCKILLVEDNKLNVLVAKKLLSIALPQGQFIEAENGQMALDKLNAGERPDIVLMDMHMPVMDGLETTRAIRAHQDARLARLPIIAMTANATGNDMQKCKEAGMDDFVSKPFDTEVVARKIWRFLQTEKQEVVA